jgi:hypothetical protein
MTSRETQTAHKHRRPTKRDFEGKTIKRFSRTADNIWRFWFTDGSSFAIHVLSVRREPLSAIDREDVKREGFPRWDAPKFVEFFCQSHHGCTLETIATRIEFENV